MHKLVICCLMAFLLCPALAHAASLRLPQVLSDRMVLQRDQPVDIWGWGEDGQAVTVTFNGQSHKATVTDGRWRITLDPLKAGGPFEMNIQSAEESIVIRDVLVGEVWFACGQSNMMMGLSGATGGSEFYENHHGSTDGRVRTVKLQGPRLKSEGVRRDVDVDLAWKTPSRGFSAVSYYFAHKLYKHLGGDVPVGVITASAIVPAEAWVDAERLASQPNLKHLLSDGLDVAGKGYNGTIAPLSPYGIRGVLYYQGEYNAGRPQEFRYLMPALIDSWRDAWGRPELPFLFVQLPGFITNKADQSELDMSPEAMANLSHADRYRWTAIRESQLDVWQNTPHTGMAVTIDVGDPYDIHPKNKEPVADRLLLSARHVAYGEDVVHSGPVPKSFEVDGEAMIVRFTHVGTGLHAKDGDLRGFELADADGSFHQARARIDGDRVIVTAPEVKAPTKVRYAWASFPDANLYNNEELPATPFRHRVPGKASYPATAEFSFQNPSFEKVTSNGAPAAWRIRGAGAADAEVEKGSASEGERAIRLAPEVTMSQAGLAVGAGGFWNDDPTAPHFLRPGSVVGYRLDMAVVGEEGQTGRVFANLCRGASGEGYQTWGGVKFVTTAESEFVTRHIAQRITDRNIRLHLAKTKQTAGARFLNQSEGVDVRLDNVSPVRIVRPLLRISRTDPVIFRDLKPGASKTSDTITVANGQADTVAALLADDEQIQQLPTVLYGCAAFPEDETGRLQILTAKTDDTGAVLLGADAERFELVGDHATEDKHAVRFIGGDGEGGLVGGETPEAETFAVRFTGASEPGTYRATLRIVTQAANLGVRSTAQQGEPPVNLFYSDIPIEAAVEDSE